MDKYQVKKHECLLDPTFKEIDEAMDTLCKVLRADKKMMPSNNSLIVFLFAGLGFLYEASQALV